MIRYRGLALPDGEEHLMAWMDRAGELVAGKPTYQLSKYRAALALLPAGRRRHAVDVGAHAGLWTRVMSLDFERVTAFEPVKAHLDCLFENTADRPNVWVRARALGAAPGTVRLHNRTRGSTGDTGVALADEVGGPAVPLERLDDQDFRALDLLKIDNEGYECFVVQGGRETLRRFRPVVIVEQKPRLAARYGLRDQQAVEELEALGMRVVQEISGDFVMHFPEAR